MRRHQECLACNSGETCLYYRVFEPTITLPDGAALKNGSRLHPFVIEPPLETKKFYKPGDTLEYGLILFGEFNAMLPHFIQISEEMGRIGLGKQLGRVQRGNFALEKVLHGERTIYPKDDGSLLREDVAEELSLNLSPPPEMHSEKCFLRLKLETPLRFKQNGRLSDGLSFETLLRLILRRACSLFEAFGGGEPDLDYRGLVAHARSIRTERLRISWVDWDRYSSRQQVRMQLGGLIGIAEYSGNLLNFLPLLRFAERVHIGKQTSFGLGRISFDLKNSLPLP